MIMFYSLQCWVALHYAPIAAQNSRLVIDNSSAFRKKGYPFVVPEINGNLIDIITELSPIQIALLSRWCYLFQFLDHLYALQKIVVSTYQSVSGSGHKGIETLLAQRNGRQDLGVYQSL
jgi:aspartate-semialdehyde dehydrogenase